jgi:hypothetical protein
MASSPDTVQKLEQNIEPECEETRKIKKQNRKENKPKGRVVSTAVLCTGDPVFKSRYGS